MRYVRIFLLYFERVFQYRSMIFVWFLASFFHPLVYLMFWKGRMLAGNGLVGNFSDITTYYLLFIIAGGFFVHVDADAYPDIVQGNLSAYLMKPLSYLKIKFFSELPWRLIQGFFGLIALFMLVTLMNLSFNIILLPQTLLMVLFVAIGGYFVLFLFKMIVLLSALWVEDIGGFQQFVEMLLIIFAGFIMPIRHFPPLASAIANITPFPYMVYYPVIAFQGQVNNTLVQILLMQLLWLFLLYLIYQQLWRRGIQKFTAVGT